ncbi:MAG: hypothetical protein JXJ04_09645 [Spirochaetales bacterium]|nr:hypothetical protein [Spirochaetales bacterium]
MKKKYVTVGIVFISLVLFCSPVFSQATPDPVEEPEYPECADANQDGFVDIIDALLIAQCYVSLAGCNCDFGPCPDVNCSGEIDIIDALLIAQYYVGLLETLCC